MAVDVTARQREALTEAAEALRALRNTASDEALVKKASHALGRVRYFTRFLEQVEAFEEEVMV
jgi:molecular chaperone HscB